MYLTINTLLFLFVFAFRVPYLGNSSYFASVVIFIITMLSNGKRNKFISIVSKKETISLLVFFASFTWYFVFFILLKSTYDFSFLRSFINLGGSILFCVCFVACIVDSKSNLYKCFYELILFQSLFVVVMMFFPSVREVIQSIILPEDAIDRMATYMGVRGLGLAGSVAFGFAVTMALLLLLSSKWFFVDGPKNRGLLNILIIVLFCFASLSAGRTAIIGFVLLIVFFMFTNVNKPIIAIKYFSYILLLAIVLYVGFTLLVGKESAIYNILFYYSKYVFQSIYNYLETGSFSVSSVSHLVEKMYFVPPGEIFFGDGLYTDSSGTYYLGTDAGYMRFVLLFGFFGSFIMYSSFSLLFLFAFLKSDRKILTMLMMVLVFAMSLILHYKGEVIMYNVSYMKIIFIYLLYEIVVSTYNKDIIFKG